MHRTTTLRIVALAAALLLGTTAAACGSDAGDDDATATTEAPATTEAASDEGEAPGEPEEATDEEAPSDAEAAGEVETTGLLEFLQGEDAAIGDLFDWNADAGVIAITYLGTQTVQLYHYGELDADAAVAACELAAEHVFAIDDAAAIEVRSGQYPDGVVVASVTGADGTCAAS